MFRLSRTCLGAQTGKVVRWLPKCDYGFIQRLADLDALEGRALWVLPHSICTAVCVPVRTTHTLLAGSPLAR